MITWTGITNRVITWAKKMQYQKPVRMNVPQMLRYTFIDQDGNVISLTNCLVLTLLTKIQGQGAVGVYTPVASVTSISNGQVECSFVFAARGIWNAQFIANMADGSKIYGDPVQFRVVPNVDDLALTELPSY